MPDLGHLTAEPAVLAHQWGLSRTRSVTCASCGALRGSLSDIKPCLPAVAGTIQPASAHDGAMHTPEPGTALR
ncbi:hypothetical protein [Leifsonia sp. Leaf264]|uniref:hypothetical protein n=1 Tax=Leifsonia sp. Leaf264 TaxID=1736314 RepID=UPI000A411646|nr:hypothetical protein [Leifsonia sp. Leaf264]